MREYGLDGSFADLDAELQSAIDAMLAAEMSAMVDRHELPERAALRRLIHGEPLEEERDADEDPPDDPPNLRVYSLVAAQVKRRILRRWPALRPLAPTNEGTPMNDKTIRVSGQELADRADAMLAARDIFDPTQAEYMAALEEARADFDVDEEPVVAYAGDAGGQALHDGAMHVLRSRGREESYTEADYLRALEEAGRILSIDVAVAGTGGAGPASAALPTNAAGGSLEDRIRALEEKQILGS